MTTLVSFGTGRKFLLCPQTVALYDFTQRRIRRRWTGHEHDVVKVLYGRSLNLVVSASRDRTIRFWNLQSDSSVLQLAGHDLVVTAIDFNPGSYSQRRSAQKVRRRIFFQRTRC